MALVKCPDCGNPISDKAAICPHCGIDVQKVLAEVREKQRQQRKKRRKSIFLLSIVVVFVAGTTVLIAYLYSIDALNTIPAEYRKATVAYFDECESAIDNGDFDKGTCYLNITNGRTLTKRQTIRYAKMENDVVELGLRELNTILTAEEACCDEKRMERFDKISSFLKTKHLDDSQTLRLQKDNDQCAELYITKLENTLGLYEGTPKHVSYLDQINRIIGYLNSLNLSETQKAQMEEATVKTERIKELTQNILNTIRDEYVRLIRAFAHGEGLGYFHYYDIECVNGEYVHRIGNGYFLCDIDSDGVPELWIEVDTREFVNCWIFAYTYDNGVRKLLETSRWEEECYYSSNGYIIGKHADSDNVCKKLIYNPIQKSVDCTFSEGSVKLGKQIEIHSIRDEKPIMDAFQIEKTI